MRIPGGTTGALRVSVAACLLVLVAGCSTIGLSDSTPAPAAKPDPQTDPIARMSAKSRYDTAVGCNSTSKIAIAAASSDVLTGYGMGPELAAKGAAEFAGYAERSAEIEAASRSDAFASGASLGKPEADVGTQMQADYTRLESAFIGVVEAQPELALFTITDRLKRCSATYPPVQ